MVLLTLGKYVRQACRPRRTAGLRRSGALGFVDRSSRYWVLVNEINLSYHSKEILIVTIDPYYGN